MLSYQDEMGTTIITNEYDKQSRVVRQTDAEGNTATLSYENGYTKATDNRGRTTYTYDENGNRLTETRVDGAVMSYTYLTRGLPLTVTDYEGNTDTYTYDAAGNVLTFTNGEGDTIHFEYDKLNRMVTQEGTRMFYIQHVNNLCASLLLIQFLAI